MSIDTGRLRHRVRIEKYDYIRDTSGDVIQDPQTGETSQEWTEVKEVWAAVEPLSAREFIAAQATQSKVTARVVIRHLDGLDSSMRIIHMRKNMMDVIYNPEGFLSDKDSGIEYLTIPVSTGVNDSGR